MNNISIVDCVAVAMLLIGLYTGIRRGLSGELARLIAAGAAVYAALHFSTPAADFVMQQRNLPQEQAYIWSFTAILIVAFLLMGVVRIVLRGLMTFAFKGRIEHVGGAICGLLRASVIVAVILLMLSFVPQDDIRIAVTEDSHVGRFVCHHLKPVYDNLQQRVPQLKLPGSEEIPAEESGSTDEPVEQMPIWDDTSTESTE